METTRHRVLVTGATGFVGNHLVAALRQEADVVGVSRTSSHPQDIICDLAQTQLAASHLEGVKCLYHLAAFAHAAPPGDAAGREAVFNLNTAATLRLAEQAARAGVERFVFLSTSKVLGDESESPLSEDAPMRPIGVYAESKAEAEDGLNALAASTRMQICIVRPPLVYGPGVRANFRALLGLAASRWPLPLADACRLRSFVSVANLVAFLNLVGQAERPNQGVFHVTDRSSVAVEQLLREIRALLGQPSRLVRVPEGVMRVLGKLFGKADAVARLYDGMQVSDGRARAVLDWVPPVARAAALEETVNWYLTNR